MYVNAICLLIPILFRCQDSAVVLQCPEDQHQHEHHGADDARNPQPAHFRPLPAVHHRETDVVHQRETEGDGEDAGIFAAQHRLEMEGHVPLLKLAPLRPECRHGDGPVEVLLTELPL